MTTLSTDSDETETGWPIWVNATSRLVGRQEPADQSWFDGDERDGDRAAELARRAGVRTLPWQWLSLRKILSRRPDGLWTHPDCLLIATRQSGKSEVLIHRLIFGLFVLGERQVLSSQRWVTSEAIFKRLKAIIESQPSLQKRLAKDPSVNSSRAVIELKSGAVVALGVRSGDLGRGMDAIDLVVFDEAYNLTEVEVSALIGAQLASPNSQTIYTSTPPVWEKHPDCQVLADMRRLGQRRQPDLYFAEWAAPKDSPRDDPETWRLASPSYGVIQKDRDVARMLAKARTPVAKALFDADFLGWGDWPPDESEVSAVIPADAWDAMVDETPGLAGPVALAVDRSPDRQTWAIAAAQRTTDGRVHIEVGFNRAASNSEVLAYLVTLVEEWDPCAIAIDAKSAAAPLQPYLAEWGIEPVLSNASQLVNACGGFLDDALQGRLSHTGQDTLREACASAAKRDLQGGGFAWQKSSQGAITALCAATLSRWALLEFGPASVPKVFARPLMTGSAEGDDVTFLDLDRVRF